MNHFRVKETKQWFNADIICEKYHTPFINGKMLEIEKRKFICDRKVETVDGIWKYTLELFEYDRYNPSQSFSVYVANGNRKLIEC